jgi:Icc-related predicted phosphoesterase
MCIVFISDLHDHCDALPFLPEADLIVIGGDLTQFGNLSAVAAVLERVQQRQLPYLAVLGNLDPEPANDLLEEQGISLQLQQRLVDGRSLFGIGGANTTPFNTPYEWSDEEMAAQLAHSSVPGSLDILVSHAPPQGSGADRVGNQAVGSQAVADFIERCRPALVLCGHIHEADGIYAFADAIVVNPGPFGPQGRYAYIDWPDGQNAPAVWLAQCR